MKRIKAILATFGIVSLSLLPAVGIYQIAVAEDFNLTGGVTCGATNEINPAGCDPAATGGGTSVTDLASKIINIFSWIVGIVSVIMIIFGGFKYITSGGNDSAVSSAKNTIMYAIIGLVVVAMAQIIVLFVLDNLNKASV